MGEKKNTVTISKTNLIELIIIIAIIVGIIIAIVVGLIENAPFNNTGKNYKDAVFKSYSDCENVIFGTIEKYGDDRGYYCYETTDTYGRKVWKTGKVDDY